MGPPPIGIPKRLRLIALDAVCLCLLLALLLLLPDLALATPLGPDTQPSPRLVERHTDTLWILLWGAVFLAITCVGPFLAIGYFLSDTTSGNVAGGMIYETLNQVSQGKRLDPYAAMGAGLATYFGPPLAFIFIGPFGLYELSIKPVLMRNDEATATVCCLASRVPPQDIVLSNDGRWLLAHHSEWALFGDDEVAGNVYLVDTTAGAFVRFRGKNGKHSPYWRVAEGVKGLNGLRDVSWDPSGGRYLRADFAWIDHRRNRSNSMLDTARYDLRQIGLGPVLFERPLVSARENFRLVSYVGETATFASLERRVVLDVGGDTLTVDASGTIAAVITYDMDSWLDAGTVTFWHLPTGQRIREYKVRYLPTNPSWRVSYGGDVWVYLIDDHIKIFRPTEGWMPMIKGTEGGPSNPWLN